MDTQVQDGSRRKRTNPKAWTKNIKRNCRNSLEVKDIVKPMVSCRHSTPNAVCAAAQLLEEERRAFRKLVHRPSTAAKQNANILKFLALYSPQRLRRRTDANRRPRINVQYLVRAADGTLRDVCATAFIGITGYTRRRLNLLARHLFETGEANPERRGGTRQTPQQQETTESIIAFIRKQKVVDSHYNARKSGRQYLTHELNLLKLYKLWLAERRTANLSIAKRSKFAKVFYERFNIGFGQPKADVCSTCKVLEAATKEGSEEDRKEAATRFELHTLRWRKFYRILDAARQACDTLTVVFDLQQTMPLPRTNVTQAFYKRQIWLYNLGMIIHNCKRKQDKQNVFLYTWLESQAGRGSNEITSCLRDFLHRIKKTAAKRRYRHLHLVSDSCAGQNKNSTMLMCLLEYVNSSAMVFKDVTFTFPIVGHSYIPPDRVFGRIEKCLRKKEEILSPEEYHEELRAHGTVRVYPQDWSRMDYKKLADSALKSTQALKIRDTRVWKFKKNSSVIHMANTYGSNFQTHTPLKKNVVLRNRKPLLLRPQSHVSGVKLQDVRELLKCVHLTTEQALFYSNISSSMNVADDLRHPKCLTKNKH